VGFSTGERLRVRFGPFVFDAGTRQLLCGELERHLGPKACDLLGLLLSQRPTVVTRRRIRERLWPATAVAESTLATVVAELRAALGNDPGQPRYLRTVRGVGYAFCGEATESGPPPSAASAGALSHRLLFDDREISLHEGENLLGRVEEGRVWIESPTVSRRHARILVEGDRAFLEDLASKNGTFLRGERIASPAPLADGDEIRLGRVTLTLRIMRSEKATLTSQPD
jgi:DNA-binding winged helix-turn-helix (wHTH) protein